MNKYKVSLDLIKTILTTPSKQHLSYNPFDDLEERKKKTEYERFLEKQSAMKTDISIIGKAYIKTAENTWGDWSNTQLTNLQNWWTNLSADTKNAITGGLGGAAIGGIGAGLGGGNPLLGALGGGLAGAGGGYTYNQWAPAIGLGSTVPPTDNSAETTDPASTTGKQPENTVTKNTPKQMNSYYHPFGRA